MAADAPGPDRIDAIIATGDAKPGPTAAEAADELEAVLDGVLERARRLLGGDADKVLATHAVLNRRSLHVAGQGTTWRNPARAAGSLLNGLYLELAGAEPRPFVPGRDERACPDCGRAGLRPQDRFCSGCGVAVEPG